MSVPPTSPSESVESVREMVAIHHTHIDSCDIFSLAGTGSLLQYGTIAQSTNVTSDTLNHRHAILSLHARAIGMPSGYFTLGPITRPSRVVDGTRSADDCTCGRRYLSLLCTLSGCDPLVKLVCVDRRHVEQYTTYRFAN